MENQLTTLDKNAQALSTTMMYLGFGNDANEKIKSAIAQGNDLARIELSTRPKSPDLKEGDQVNYEMNFTKAKDSGTYFLNSYKASIVDKDDQVKAEHTFLLNNGKGVTAKEAFNLLSGRAVNTDIKNKENIDVNVWLKLDVQNQDGPKLKYFNENYGFQLEKVIAEVPIKYSESFPQEKIMDSLKKGNLQAVLVKEGDKLENRFISANPQFKRLEVYDKDLKPLVPIRQKEIEQRAQKPWEGGEEKQERKNNINR